MEFGLSADQKLMAVSVERALAKCATLERVRAFADGDEPVARDIWQALAEIGVTGLMIDEAHGGLGLGLLDAAVVAEQFGAQATPAPFLGSAVLAPLALANAPEPVRTDWLPKFAAGEAIAGIAINETIAGARDGGGVAERNGRLSGTSLFAMDASGADVLLAADRSGGLHLVEGEAAGLEIAALTTIDGTRRLAEVRFADTPARSIGDREILHRLRDAAFIMLAADTLGAGQAMIDKAVAYAKERRQFGRPIASFQAVKHLCAEMTARLEPCRALVWYAAHAFDAAPEEAPLIAAHAKAHLAEVGRFVARTATEVHGGIGFTDLLGLHLWFKRIGLDRQLLGGPEQIRAHAARLQALAG